MRMTIAVIAVATLLPPLTVSGQTVVDNFNPGANGDVYALAVQTDGKILAGGNFTLLGGGQSGLTPRNHIGRLNADGTLDVAFNPGANGRVSVIVLQPDGKILVGGEFTMIGGGGTGNTPRPGIARLNNDGSLDVGFNPPGQGVVRDIGLQPDGRILSGGSSGIRRLTVDGSDDSAFAPAVWYSVDAMAVLADGRFVASYIIPGVTRVTPNGMPQFNRFNRDGSPDKNFAAAWTPLAALFAQKVLAVSGFSFQADVLRRLNDDGSVENGFAPSVSGSIGAVASLPDGKILVGGLFTGMSDAGSTTEIPRHNVGLLNAAGSVDVSFNPGANGQVRAFAVQPDGGIVVGGAFTTFGGGGTGGAIRHRIARVPVSLGTAPLLVDVSPKIGSTAGGTTVTISGFNLRPGAAVTIGGVAAMSVSRVNAGTLTAVTGPHASGPTDIVVTNSDLQTATLPGAFRYGPIMAVNRKTLSFVARTDGQQFLQQTPSQEIRLTQSGTGVVTWTAKPRNFWVKVSPDTGTGPATILVSIPSRSDAEFVFGTTSTIDITFEGAGNTVAPIPVTLTLESIAAPPSRPFGVVDTPAGDGTVLAGSVAVTGWTLDDIGIKRVEIWRDVQPGETTPPFRSTPTDPRDGKIFIATPTFVDGARPDIEALNPNSPANYRAGWGYLMLTHGLYAQGNGTYTLHVYAFDEEDNVTTLGTKTIVVNNAAATRPFGSIDSPAVGGNPGTAANVGWALTPNVNGVATCRIPSNGVQVSIDSGPLQPVVYGDARPDIAGALPGLSNSAAAGGHFNFDWSTLTNGPHTIGWLVTDDCGRADGIGSRFFTVTNGTSAAAGFRLMADTTEERDSGELLLSRGYGELPQIVVPDVAGSLTIELKQGERIELRTPRGYDTGYQLGPNGERRALPIGSTWDAASGTFYWRPAPGFLGRYRLVFSNGDARINVRVIVVPDDRVR